MKEKDEATNEDEDGTKAKGTKNAGQGATKPLRSDVAEDVGGKPSFAAPGQRPKDFHRFQKAVRNQIREL